MKKFLALILAMLLMMSMTVALASGDVGGETPTYTDVSTITITKSYKAANGGVSPAETFGFTTFEKVEILENDEATWPEALPTITSVAYAEGDATAAGNEKTATITLPKFDAVGIYVYTFKEAIPETLTAGVTYNDEDLYLVVTVVEEDGKKRVAAVHCEGNYTPGTYNTEPKTDVFENTYESGTLAVTKTVTGNLGNKGKYFDVTVTFTAASGEQINSTIKYSGGSKYEDEVTVVNNTATIQMKDGDTVTFTNIPEGVTWKVEEADYSSEKYDPAQYSTQTDSIAAGDADTCDITHNKSGTVDTGISLETLPYVLMMVLALAGTALMIVRRRRSNED